MSRAADHLLRQMQKDPRLAWLIGPGSRSYELITEEGTRAAGQDLESFRAAHESTLQFRPWPRSDEQPTATLHIDLDELLTTRVQPGEQLSLADVLTRFSLPATASSENAIRRTLLKAGFTPVREPAGLRRRLWAAPDQRHPGCPPAPHTAPDTPPSQHRAFHPQESFPDPLPTETQQQAVQPGQIEPHQTSVASPPPVNGKSGSLAVQGGAA